MNTELTLWLDKRDQSDSAIVIFEQENLRITVRRDDAFFEIHDTDRVGLKRWRDIDVDWGVRRMLTILAKQQIELAKRQTIDEPARQD